MQKFFQFILRNQTARKYQIGQEQRELGYFQAIFCIFSEVIETLNFNWQSLEGLNNFSIYFMAPNPRKYQFYGTKLRDRNRFNVFT